VVDEATVGGADALEGDNVWDSDGEGEGDGDDSRPSDVTKSKHPNTLSLIARQPPLLPKIEFPPRSMNRNGPSISNKRKRVQMRTKAVSRIYPIPSERV